MNIVIDLGHPGHFHYFKHAIRKMGSNHKFLIFARDRKYVKELLEEEGLEYVNRGPGRNSFFGKFIYLFQANYLIYTKCKAFKPDLFLSFSSSYVAQVAFLMNKPHIAINDTEHEDRLHSILTYPFSSSILTPECYLNDLGKKHLRFKAVIEDLYLHPGYFDPDPDISKILGIGKDDEFVILRFVSWNAHHDYRQSGMTIDTKREIIRILKSNYKIFISSEGDLPEEFMKYALDIDPSKMHSVLAKASMFIGESATMASESVLLGVPAIYVNTLPLMGYLNLEQDMGMLKHFESNEGIIDYLKEVLEIKNMKSHFKNLSQELKRDFINSTDFLVWFLENYPKSHYNLKEDPDFQNRFK